MRYRKKPIEIDVFQMTEAVFIWPDQWPQWLVEAQAAGKLVLCVDEEHNTLCQVRTLEGVMICQSLGL